jgi:hypothetical protein
MAWTVISSTTFCQWSRISEGHGQLKIHWYIIIPQRENMMNGNRYTHVSRLKKVHECEIHWQSDGYGVLGLQNVFL